MLWRSLLFQHSRKPRVVSEKIKKPLMSPFPVALDWTMERSALLNWQTVQHSRVVSFCFSRSKVIINQNLKTGARLRDLRRSKLWSPFGDSGIFIFNTRPWTTLFGVRLWSSSAMGLNRFVFLKKVW
jgi:hypothetical protein